MSTLRIKLVPGTFKFLHQRPKGGNMNSVMDKWTVDAANYFKEEVLDIMPDIPGEELSGMVGEYIFYQQADVSKNDAHTVVEATCTRR